jgi:hypothetical protein
LAWAAGNVTDGAHPGQLIERWNGTKWSLFSSPKFGKKGQADVFAMTASSANDVWAIGSLMNRGTGLVSPLFEHWNGTAWTATTVESNNEFLFGASADATNDAWAVGFNGSDNVGTAAMHWDTASHQYENACRQMDSQAIPAAANGECFPAECEVSRNERHEIRAL